jgi:hypothetical protein
MLRSICDAGKRRAKESTYVERKKHEASESKKLNWERDIAVYYKWAR